MSNDEIDFFKTDEINYNPLAILRYMKALPFVQFTIHKKYDLKTVNDFVTVLKEQSEETLEIGNKLILRIPFQVFAETLFSHLFKDFEVLRKKKKAPVTSSLFHLYNSTKFEFLKDINHFLTNIHITNSWLNAVGGVFGEESKKPRGKNLD